MDITTQQLAEIREQWEKGIANPNVRAVVVNIKAIKCIPEIAEYDGNKIILLLPNTKLNPEYLEKLREAVDLLEPLPTFTGNKID